MEPSNKNTEFRKKAKAKNSIYINKERIEKNRTNSENLMVLSQEASQVKSPNKEEEEENQENKSPDLNKEKNNRA